MRSFCGATAASQLATRVCGSHTHQLKHTHIGCRSSLQLWPYLYLHVLALTTCTLYTQCSMYLNNRVHSALRIMERERKTKNKIYNIPSGLEKYSSIFGKQSQRLRIVHTSHNLSSSEKYVHACTCACTYVHVYVCQ